MLIESKLYTRMDGSWDKSSTSIKLLPNIELTYSDDSEDYIGIDDIDGVEIMLLD